MEEHMDDQEHSSPGEPPYVKTDTLRQSITYQMTGKGTAVVGPDPDFVGFDDRGNAKVVGDYAELLEFGGGKIQPRPYMTPILGDISVSNKVLRIIKTGKR
jgi:hypothetical protein